MLAGMIDVHGHWIDGALTTGVGDRSGLLRDPITGEVTAEIAYAVSSDVDAAVAAAQVAFRTWGGRPHAERAGVLGRFRDLLRAHSPQLAAVVAAEHGKSPADARGELARGLEVVDLASCEPEAIRDTSVDPDRQLAGAVAGQPHGVVAVVCDTQLPAMGPLWFFPLALAAGNTVIVAPGDTAPTVTRVFAELLAEAGLPAGCFNVLHGDVQTAAALVSHGHVAAVSIIAPSRRAHRLHRLALAYGKAAHALGRSKGHVVVLPDANLDLAVGAVLGADVGPAGEWMTTTSVIVVVDAVADELVDRVRQRTRLVSAPHARGASSGGALVTPAHRAGIERYLTAGLRSGARLALDGRAVVSESDRVGFWLSPTVLDRVTPDMPVYAEEVYGPVLLIMRAASTQAAIEQIARQRLLGAVSVVSDDADTFRRCRSGLAALDAAVVANAAPELSLQYRSWGDWAASLFADPRTHAAQGADFYTRHCQTASPTRLRWARRQAMAMALG
jgi:malonate-semialdehyde dehydrogenase (acetylating)/methylmalonate-semialdehyde dehydrogenase